MLQVLEGLGQHDTVLAAIEDVLRQCSGRSEDPIVYRKVCSMAVTGLCENEGLHHAARLLALMVSTPDKVLPFLLHSNSSAHEGRTAICGSKLPHWGQKRALLGSHFYIYAIICYLSTLEAKASQFVVLTLCSSLCPGLSGYFHQEVMLACFWPFLPFGFKGRLYCTVTRNVIHDRICVQFRMIESILYVLK